MTCCELLNPEIQKFANIGGKIQDLYFSKTPSNFHQKRRLETSKKELRNAVLTLISTYRSFLERNISRNERHFKQNKFYLLF